MTRLARLVRPLLGVLALGLTAGAALADPPLWRVKAPHAEIDLFGSVHLLSSATSWKDPALMDALAHADEVWFEIPLDADAKTQAAALMMRQGLLPEGQTLQGLLPPDLWTRTLALAGREGLPEARLQRMRPWLAELVLSVLYFQREGARADLGVEQEIDAAAPKAAMRGAFETLADQVALFADDPLPEQIASLRQTLHDIQTDPGLYARMVAAWRAGDVSALKREALDPMRQEDEALYQRLVVARNRRFAAKIETLAKGDKRVLVVVGIAHLIGPDGVPALLRRDGLTVEGP